MGWTTNPRFCILVSFSSIMANILNRHYLLSLRRSAFRSESCWLRMLKFGFYLLVTLSLALISVNLDVVVVSLFHKSVALSLLLFALIFVSADFLLKVKSSDIDCCEYLPYLVTPLASRRIVLHEVFKSMLSLKNFYGALFLLPFMLRLLHYGEASVALLISYIFLAYTVELCLHSFVLGLKSLSKVKFAFFFTMFSLACLGGLFLFQGRQSVPLCVACHFHNALAILTITACLMAAYFFSMNSLVGFYLRHLYESRHNDHVVSLSLIRPFHVGAFMKLYVWSILRCRQTLYVFAIFAIMAIGITCDWELFAFRKVFCMCLILSMSISCLYIPSQLISTCADGVFASTCEVESRLILASFRLSILWSGTVALLVGSITHEFQLCFCAFLVCNGSVFFFSSRTNSFVRERFDVLKPNFIKRKLDTAGTFNQSLPFFICYLWSLSCETDAFIIVSLALSFPFIAFVRSGINHHASKFKKLKYSYLESIR